MQGRNIVSFKAAVLTGSAVLEILLVFRKGNVMGVSHTGVSQ